MNDHRKTENVDLVQTTGVLKIDQCKSYKVHWINLEDTF